jgi:transposase InsO family protein
VRYAAIAEQSSAFSVRSLCRVLEVSTSGYYAWCDRRPSLRSQQNERLVEAMRKVHREVDPAYGSPRMHTELLANGFECGRHRVARLMRQHGLVARPTVRFRRLTKAGKRVPAAPNILDRQFTVSAPNRVWASDITYIQTAEGHLYLAVVLDLYSRRVVGWAMTERLGAVLVTTALRQALQRRSVKPGLLHHSDRDGLYSSAAYKHLLAEHAMTSSMSRKGNCYDNACVESFFATLKTELVAFERFESRAQARQKLFVWIETKYNRSRRHSTLGYISPVDYEHENYHA